MSAQKDNLRQEIDLLLKAMSDLFQEKPFLQEEDIRKLKRNDDKIWVPICQTLYGYYEYKLAMRLKKRWINNNLFLRSDEPMNTSPSSFHLFNL